MNNREAFEAWAEKELLPLDRRDSEHYRYNLTNRAWAGWNACLASQVQQTESNLHWCGTCEQNVERGCGDSTCQYRYKLPPAPEGGDK